MPGRPGGPRRLGFRFYQPRSAAFMPVESRAYFGWTLAQADLRGYWRHGENAGTTAYNETGRFHGTYQATFTLGAAGALVGDANTAATLSGAGYVLLATNPLLHPGDVFTFRAWVKRSAVGTTQVFWDPGPNEANLFFDTGNALNLRKDSVATLFVTTATFPDTTAFHQYVFTKNGTAYAIYVDGQVQAGTDSGNQTIVAGTNAPNLYGDGTAGLSPMQGTVDETALYGVAWNATQVATDYIIGRALFAPFGNSEGADEQVAE